METTTVQDPETETTVFKVRNNDADADADAISEGTVAK